MISQYGKYSKRWSISIKPYCMIVSDTKVSFLKYCTTGHSKQIFIRHHSTDIDRQSPAIQAENTKQNQQPSFQSENAHFKGQVIKREDTDSTIAYQTCIKDIQNAGRNPSTSDLHMLVSNVSTFIVANPKLSISKLENVCRKLFFVFKSSTDVFSLISLKVLWEEHLARRLKNPLIKSYYLSTYIHIGINSKQIFASKMIEQIWEEFTNNQIKHGNKHIHNDIFLNSIPLKKLFNMLIMQRDYINMEGWLRFFNENCADSKRFNSQPLIEDEIWVKCLNAAISGNEYQLTKYIYKNWVISGLDEIHKHDLMFQNIRRKDESFCRGEKILTPNTLSQILKVFSSNGDVSLTLKFIEYQHMFKEMRGSKSLRKDLCIRVIDSYAFHPDLQGNWIEDEMFSPGSNKDESIMRLLDILDKFVVNLRLHGQDTIKYNEISNSFSFKFMNYKYIDENVLQEISKRNRLKNKISNSIEDDFDEENKRNRLQKLSTLNLHSSKMGNILANTGILKAFVSDHCKYILQKDFDITTIKVFVNCILNHMNIYQNFNGTINVLSNLYDLNRNFAKEWLDSDSYKIIMNSASNSNSAKLCSINLMNFLRNNSLIEESHYICLISANLRGNFYESIQYIMYHYLLDFGGNISKDVGNILNDIPEDVIYADHKFACMYDFIMNPQSSILNRDKVLNFWATNSLISKNPKIANDNLSNFSRYYSFPQDEKNAKIVLQIFPIKG